MSRWILRLTLLAALLVPAALLGAQRAHACSCVEPPPPLEALDDVDAVFSGTVTSLEFDERYGVLLTFAVDRVSKGPVAETLFATTSSLGEGDCGFPFAEGTAYIVYASADDGAYRVWLCSRTGLLEHAQQDLEALGEGQVPGSGTTGPVPGEAVAPAPGDTGTGLASGACDTTAMAAGLSAAGAVALAALAYATLRRRARRT